MNVKPSPIQSNLDLPEVTSTNSITPNVNYSAAAPELPSASALTAVAAWAQRSEALDIVGEWVACRPAARCVFLVALMILDPLAGNSDQSRSMLANPHLDSADRSLSKELAARILAMPPRKALRRIFGGTTPFGLTSVIERASQLELDSVRMLCEIYVSRSPIRRQYLNVACKGLQITDSLIESAAVLPTALLSVARRPLFQYGAAHQFKRAWVAIADRLDLRPIRQSLKAITKVRGKLEFGAWLSRMILHHARPTDSAKPFLDDEVLTCLVTGPQLVEVQKKFGWCLSNSYVGEIVVHASMVPVMVSLDGAHCVVILHRISNANRSDAWVITNIYGACGGCVGKSDQRRIVNLLLTKNSQIYARTDMFNGSDDLYGVLGAPFRFADDFETAFGIDIERQRLHA